MSRYMQELQERALADMATDVRHGHRPRPLEVEMRIIWNRDRAGGPACQDPAAWEDVT